MANFQVSKEYVRGQLVSMGIQNISEEDLEAYTRGIQHLSCRQIISIKSVHGFVLFLSCFVFQIFLDWLKDTLIRMTLLLTARVRQLTVRRLALEGSPSQRHMEHHHHLLIVAPHSTHLSILPLPYGSLVQLYSR